MRRLLGFLLVLLSPAAGLWFVAQQPTRVVIMHTNDLHGQLLPRAGVGGIAEIATIIRAAKPDLVLDAGDISTGTFLSDEFKGQPTILAMNEIGYVAGTIGNHEFDYGQGALRSLLRAAKFPVLSANLETPIPEIRKYTVVTAKGIRFGIIGLTTRSLETTTHPKNLNGVTAHDLVKTLEQLLPQVRSRSDVIIVTAHLENDEEARVASAFPEIRLIVAGHSHTPVGPVWVGQTLVTKTGSSGRNVGRVEMEFINRKLVRMGGALIPVRDTKPDGDTSRIIRRFNEKVEDKMAEVLGEATADLLYFRNAESPLADIVADALREKARTDIAIHNIGGIRANIWKGKITWGDIFEVLPFQNTVVTLRLTGAQLKRILERGPGELALSGVRVRFDRSGPGGWRLMSVTLADGDPIDDSKLYTVTTNDFVLAGGDGFVEFAKGTDTIDTGLFLRDALVEYVKNRRILSPKLDGRIAME